MKLKIYYLATFIAIVIFYLNYTYAHIFNYISAQNMNYPEINGTFEISSNESSTNKPVTYVALGDSLTAGAGSKWAEDSYPYMFAQKLTGIDQKVKLINLGVPGALTKDVFNFQLARTIAENPQIITLLIGTNDMNNYVSLKEFRIYFESIIEDLQKKTKAKILVASTPYLGAPSLYLPPYNWFFDFRTKQYNNVIKSVLNSEINKDIIFVDLYKETNKQFKKNYNLYSKDLFHPSAEGYKLFGDIFYANYR